MEECGDSANKIKDTKRVAGEMLDIMLRKVRRPYNFGVNKEYSANLRWGGND